MQTCRNFLKTAFVLVGGLLLLDCDNGAGIGADIAVDKTGPAAIVRGQTAAFQVVVTNSGVVDALNVQVDDITPAGLTFQSNSGDCSGPYPCDLGSIAAGESVTITSVYFVPDDYSGPEPLSNEAEVTAGFLDSDGNTIAERESSNNSSTVFVPVQDVPSSSSTLPVASTTLPADTTTTLVETSTTLLETTTTTTTAPGCMAQNALHNVAFIEKYTCVQKFTAGSLFCADQNVQDTIKFKHLGAGVYEARNFPTDTGFLYNGQLSCNTFTWTAAGPEGYQESGTWNFALNAKTFSGTSAYVANDNSYSGNCTETGATSPTVPPNPVVLPPCM